MTGDDWTDYITTPAPKTLLCQFRRKDRFFAHTGYAKDFLPEFNVAGLEWKLIGIAKEQLSRMPEVAKQQVMPMDALSAMVQRYFPKGSIE